MNLTILDHTFGLFLGLVLPFLGAWQFRRLKARMATGDPDARIGEYRGVVISDLVATATVLALWLTLDRPLELLVPAAPVAWAWSEWAGWAATVIICIVLVLQVLHLERDGEDLADARKQLGPVAEFLPHTARELRYFRVLSLAAGISEEVVYRGFVMAWLTALASGGLGLGTTAALCVAVLGSSAMFGLVHSYQGPAGMVKTGAVGLVLAGVAVATGGLLAPMLLHVVLDLTSGQVAYLALRIDDPTHPRPVMT